MIRIRITSFIIICIFLFLVLNLFLFEVIKGKKFKELSNKNCIRLIPQDGGRGRILDREGNIIVGNELCYDVMIASGDAKQLDNTLMNVSRVLGSDFKGLKNTFKGGLMVSSVPMVIAKNIDLKKAIALEELKPDLDGIIIQPRPQRVYPYGRLACHVLGYLNEIDHWRLTKLADYGYKTRDIVGFGGVEEKYDYYLHQEEGGLSVEVDHRGRFIRTLGFRPPKGGKDIQLTLNLKIQKIAEENLSGKTGCVILMDPHNGEIVAMASWPNFNPSVFVKKANSSIYGIFNNPEAPLINRAIGAKYPAGSVFKLVVATGGLETGKIKLSTTFICPGSINIGKQKFSCWDTHYTQNLNGAITRSCNVFFYRTGLLLGGQLIHDYALKLGFSKATSVDLPYEESGFLPHPLWRKIYRFSRLPLQRELAKGGKSGMPFFTGKSWLDGDTVNLSIGQGELLVTPLQITRMMAVFANRGNLVTPYIVKAIDGRDVSVYQRRITALPIKMSTIDAIRAGLKNVVSSPAGTGNVLSSLCVSVAGKTGTAQAPPNQPHAWFTGFFPFKNPKFVICVFLEHGGSGYHATVLAKQIIEAMIQEDLI